MTPDIAKNISRQDQCEAAQRDWFRSLTTDQLVSMMHEAVSVQEIDGAVPTPRLMDAALVAFLIVGTSEMVRRVAEIDGG